MSSPLTDEQLVARFHGGDKGACEEILSRYKNRVLSVARRFFLSGGDTEDLVQEGMCGLYSAIVGFSGNVGFQAYADACIKNRILDAVKRSYNNKNAAMNGFLQLSDEGEEAVSGNASPEEQIIFREARREMMEKMSGALSDFEYRAICMYIEGATLPEISGALGKTYKQTDNAITRAKNKLRSVLGVK